MSANTSAAIVDSYKAIRTKLLSVFGDDTRSKVIVISSPSSKDGKTTTAINTAIAFSQLGKRVLLIDADMRSGAISKRLRLSSMFGLSDLLSGSATLDQTLISAGASLDVISSGKSVADPESLLSSEEYENLISGVKFAYDYIFIDSPAICEFNDTLYTGKSSDGVVLVLREGASAYKKIDDAFSYLGSSDIRVFGTVINAAKK